MAHRVGDVHEQGRLRDARAGAEADRQRCPRVLHRNVPLLVAAPAAPARAGGEPAAALFDRGLLGPAVPDQGSHGGALDLRTGAASQRGAGPDLGGEERPDHGRALHGHADRLRGRADRAGLRPLREEARRDGRPRLRRPDRALRAAAFGQRRPARGGAAARAAPADRRVPGHQYVAGRARQALRGGRRLAVRGRRRGPGHLPLARGGGRAHPAFRGGLPGSARRRPRVELSLDGEDPLRRRRPRLAQPAPAREAAARRPRGRRGRAAVALRGGSRRDRGGRARDRELGKAAGGDGDPLPDERAVAARSRKSSCAGASRTSWSAG